MHLKVLRDLWHLRSQMAAVAVVMACGIAMFVSLRSMHGWLRDTQTRYYEAYRFADVFANARRAPASLQRRLAAIPGAAAVRTRVVMDVTLDLPGLDEPGTGRLVGIPETRAPMLNDLYLRSGRWIEPGQADEVLASEAFARANGLAPGDSIPAVLHGRWQRLRVVGIALSPEYIYEIRGLGDIFPDNRRFGVLWMGERALGAAFQMEGAFNDVAIALAPGASEADVIDAADRLLAPYGGTGAYSRADQISDLFVSSEIDETEITSVLLPAIFLGVTAFLLNMVLARLVATQRQEIAILKAFGYGNPAIAAHYLQLALGPVLIGAVIGTGLGAWLAAALARVYARFYQFPVAGYAQDWRVVAQAFLVAGGAALVGALGGVLRATRLQPAEAMRPEAPASYRAGLIERVGLQRLVPAAARIILRNVERRPLRALLAATGIALATAIVMTGWFMFDAINVMKQIQFESVQRYDAMVVFDVPRSAAAGWELVNLPGVRRMEPFRAVPVRLRRGPVTKRTTLLGLEPGSELQRLVDRDGTVRQVPRGGLLISDVLAADLDVAAGDTLTVEVLEGKRAVRAVPVAAVSRDIIGSSATMRLDALRALLGEGGTLSGAYLTLDARQAPAVYRRLKRTPAVSGVVVRESVVRGFEETIAESFWISISMMVAFACIIAAGIVYNGARVALSERGRELASLRVLGFFRGEVTRLLLGEQALLTLIGLPGGLLLGYALAWLVAYRFESDLFRIPLVIRPTTIAYSLAVVLGAALLSALAVRRRIHRLDLIAVLKTRE
ncbi:MAG: ABC transporter permease [Gemmatimonadota bacterium]|nr:ABC transporter permease [Gemmatimonadota bacterium]MDH4348158.1 ABC transporter permease [Gemmatimonadota bacterium]MDH5197757.1 ABC transporter permease [Gemmatimonadota bacterium]